MEIQETIEELEVHLLRAQINLFEENETMSLTTKISQMTRRHIV